MLNIKLKSTKNLLRVLGTVENILKANKTDNDLKYVKFEKMNSNLYLLAMNPFMKLCYKVDDVISVEGDCALYENKMLTSLFNVIDGEVVIGDGVIKSNKCEYNIPNIAIENYPDFIIPERPNRIEINSNEFIAAIENVIDATDKAEGVLSGVYINKNKLAACDSKRVFMSNLDINESIDNIIMPKDFVSEIIKLPFEDKIYISIFNNNIIAEDSNIYISSNLLAGNYPKYEAILPKEVNKEFNISKKDFENALTLVAPIIDDVTWACNLEFNDSKLKIYTKDGKRKAETSIGIKAVSVLSEPIKVKFNIQILLDMLKANSETIDIKTYSDNIGVMFSSGNAKQYIMPLVD